MKSSRGEMGNPRSPETSSDPPGMRMGTQTKNYRHRFRVRATVDAVAAFHSRIDGFKALNLPLVLLRLHDAPGELGEGDNMAFTMWLGPIPITWKAAIEQVTANGFVDRQVSGPFAFWEHHHIFVEVGDGLTEIRDDITAAIGGSLWDRLRASLMWYGLPVLFAYRAWQTRRLLEE